MAGWKSRYQFNKGYYKAEAEKLRSTRPASVPDKPPTSTIFSGHTVPLRWRSPSPLDTLNIRALKRVQSFDLPDLQVKRRRSEGDRRVRFESPTQDELGSDYASSRPSTLKVKPTSSTSSFDGSSRGSSVTPERSISVPLPGFTRQDLQAAMAWVASRELPVDLHDNVSSWEAFAGVVSTHFFLRSASSITVPVVAHESRRRRMAKIVLLPLRFIQGYGGADKLYHLGGPDSESTCPDSHIRWRLSSSFNLHLYQSLFM